MRLRHGFLGRAAAALTLCFGVSAAAGATALDDLRGVWATAAAGPPAMEWSISGETFSVSFKPEGGEASTLEFAPSGRPGILVGRAKAGWSMMSSMFGDDEPVNPLVDGTLYWARATAEAIYFYSLTIDDRGGFELDRYRCAPEGDRLTVSVQRRTAKGADDRPEQHLVRVRS